MKNFDIEHLIVLCIAAVLCTGIGSCTISEAYKARIAAEKYRVYAASLDNAVENNVDPMTVGCAFGTQGGDGDAALCSINQMKKETK